MSDLRTFLTYVQETQLKIDRIERRLCELQQKYETFFSELAGVRESELGQLTQHIVRDRGKLPEWLDKALDWAAEEVAREFDETLARLKAKAHKLAQHAQAARDLSAKNEVQAHRRNVDLDEQEEQLKQRSSELVAEVAAYNERIRSLGGGFGFFVNLFKMRDLQAQRWQLEQTQADISARIEQLRQRWVEAEKEFTSTETDLQRQWVALQADAAAVQTKLEYLESARKRIVLRSTLEKVLYERCEAPAAPSEGDPPCPRCNARNPQANHFCCICAQRLAQDRPDLHGSAEEIAEINHHFQRFSAGMQACQQIIALVRGLSSGLEAFELSVSSMIDSQYRYPLSNLRIAVPRSSLEYGRVFDVLGQLVDQNASLHPVAFAEQITALIEQQLTEDKIQAYFETMGQELSRQAEAQW